MEHDPKIFLQHILESIKNINEFVEGLSDADFLKDLKTQDAVIRKIEIIGEATKNLPIDFKEKHDDVRWKEIAGMRDVLTHDYFGVDLQAVWNVIINDLPDLKKKIQAILNITAI